MKGHDGKWGPLKRRERRDLQRHGQLSPDTSQGIIWLFLKRHWVIVRVLALYAASLIALLILYSQLAGTSLLDRFLELNAQATGFLLNTLGADARTQSNVVMSEEFAVTIVEGCVALAPAAIFVSGVLAYPSRLSRKLLGIALGLVVLLTVNLVRTSSLFYIGATFPSMLEVAHYLVWQSIMVLLSVALLLMWVRRGYQRA